MLCLSQQYICFAYNIALMVTRMLKIHVGSYMYEMIRKNMTILYAWVSKSHICEIDIIFVLSAISNIESREKASKLKLWWSNDNSWKNMLG